MRLVALFCFCSVAFAVRAQDPALALTQTIPLPGVQGRFDHFALDTKGHRLFIAALGNNTLEVVDLAVGKRIQSVPGMSKPTGVLFLPESNQVLVANGDEGTLKVLNGTTLKPEQSLTGFDDADNLRFDPKVNLAWLGYAEGTLGIIDVAATKLVGSVKLSKHPESFQLEQGGTRIFVNVPDAKQIAVIDREKRAVITTWPMEKSHGNFPMALDESNHRLFVGCRSPARLVVLDTSTGKAVADVATSHDVDDLFFDAARKRLYLSCGEGFIDIISQRDADTYAIKEKVATRSGARTGFFSPVLNQFYVAVPHRGNQAAEVRVFAVRD